MLRLNSYLHAYLTWAENPNRNILFSTKNGLCDNIRRFVKTEREMSLLMFDLYEALREDFNDRIFPFGEYSYHLDTLRNIHHENRDRLNWIRKRLSLNQYLKSYLAWATSEEPDDTYSKQSGLCYNLCGFIPDIQSQNLLEAELKYRLIESDLNQAYPFGEYSYYLDTLEATHHKNENRLNWIRKEIS